MNDTSIAIVGMACEFPNASQPQELWENALARRQAFRAMPDCRLNRGDYVDPDPKAADKTYLRYVALIEGYHFDRVGFRISAESFSSADMVHWLTLDVVHRALIDAGYPHAKGLPRDETGVLLGNTLTGEMTRTATMRLRWPYVSRLIDRQMAAEGRTAAERTLFLAELEQEYKRPFAEVGGETLAGGLANTIAGRICNYYDLHGGGYTLDGACSSSLLAVSNACSALVCGDLDVVLAGGVDLSLDPFELVGFAKAGALSADKMYVFDKHSAGFLPGEGCGVLVLRRTEDALAAGDRIYAVIRGWGISSDGKGGLTRPETSGQLRAVERACRRAGVTPESVAYYEGHGTGTPVGDEAELSTLITARANAGQPASLGSVKANIGHTKAAAGVAALIKTSMALYTQVLPPTTACNQPHDLLDKHPTKLRVSSAGQLWPQDRELRAGVSAMGFGGINAHLVLDGLDAPRRTELNKREQTLLAPPQDGELFAFSAEDPAGLKAKLEALVSRAEGLSFAELTDLAAHLAGSDQAKTCRAAIVADSPEGLSASLRHLAGQLGTGSSRCYDQRRGIYMDQADRKPTIGFLFSGQHAPVFLDPGMLGRRYPWIRDQYLRIFPPGSEQKPLHENNQAAVMLASLVGWNLLRGFGVEADLALGHSLGELSALHWAGALNEQQLPATVMCRTCTMYNQGVRGGMLSISAPAERVEPLLHGRPAVISCYNTPNQTVVSGTQPDLDAIAAKAEHEGLKVTRLAVSHGFHSPLLAQAAPEFRAFIETQTFAPVARPVFSTVTGQKLASDIDVVALMTRQFVEPVLFQQAFAAADAETDLWIEVGPGRILTHLAEQLSHTPVVATNLGKGMKGLLSTMGAAYVSGMPVRLSGLFDDRFSRPFDPQYAPQFLVNPCEAETRPPEITEPVEAASLPLDTLALVKNLVSRQTELPLQGLGADLRLLDDLHLNSITVAALVAEATREQQKAPPKAPTELANASLAELAQVLDSLPATSESQRETVPRGLQSWLHCFVDEWWEKPLLAKQTDLNGRARWFGPEPLPLQQELSGRVPAGNHLLVLLPKSEVSHVCILLEAAKALLSDKSVRHFVLVQEGHFAASFARTLAMEAPDRHVTVVTLPFDALAADRVFAEMAGAQGYREAAYDAHGVRRIPVLRPSLLAEYRGELTCLDSNDVVLVSGGGKGITAECALALFRDSGCRFALLGRANPESDAELAANLARFRAAGCRFQYIRADVTDNKAIKAAVARLRSELGTVTAILHGAGINRPKLLTTLELEDLRETAATKLTGLDNLLAAVEPADLKLVVGFGSIIARIGLAGEAHYGLANEAMARRLEHFAATHPDCRCLTLAWSVWSGAGMGERLESLEALTRAGITPIGLDRGLEIFLRLLADPSQRGTRVVAGRFASPRTVELGAAEPPFLRFLERIQVHYPGIELIADNELSLANDPYLADHVYEGNHVLPAVMGIEAMSQAAMALLGLTEAPSGMSGLRLERPVIVPRHATLVLRVVVQANQAGDVEACIRSEETDFYIDHFRATFHFGTPQSGSEISHEVQPLLDLAPNDVYGPVFFHTGRFRRIAGYRRLHAYGCCAELTPCAGSSWFGRYLPSDLISGDPGQRDAVLHGIQACIPHKSLLPLSCGSWTRYRKNRGVQTMHARETSYQDGVYRYDIDVLGADGKPDETWRNLAFKEIMDRQISLSWHPQLMGPCLQRRLADRQKHTPMGLLLEPHDGDRASIRELLKQRLRVTSGWVNHRADGKPEAEKGTVSFAHAASLSLAVWGEGVLACDLETIGHREPATWAAMLGEHGASLATFLARDSGEDDNIAATRVWCARECLRKAGLPLETPLSPQPDTGTEALTYFAGTGVEIATLAFTDNATMIALLYEPSHTPIMVTGVCQ